MDYDSSKFFFGGMGCVLFMTFCSFDGDTEVFFFVSSYSSGDEVLFGGSKLSWG